MGLIGPFLQALAAALAVWQQERALYNNPAQVKNQLDIARQKARDALNAADAVAANPLATREEHLAAVRSIQIADS